MRFCWVILFVVPLLGQAESEAEALSLRRIAEFWQEGEVQIAKGQIEEFIAQFPTSSHAEALSAALGDLFLREKNFSKALDYYARLESPELMEQTFLNRLQCLYEMQWYATLTEACEARLEKGPDLHTTYFLAISLYRQCLNAAKDPEALQQLAERAKPHFEALAQSNLNEEVAQAYAHLCCILKDFSKASELYQTLAQKKPRRRRGDALSGGPSPI